MSAINSTYTRDATGRITAIAGLSGDDWTYGYDTKDRLIRARNLDANGAPVAAIGGVQVTEDFSYAPNGNLLTRNRIGTTNDLAITYPAASANRPHAPLTVDGVGLTYDNNGNMLSDGVRTMSWDGLNRLSTVSINGVKTAYVYGPSGSRAKKRPYAVADEAAIRTSLYTAGGSEINQPIPGNMSTSQWERVHYPHADIRISIADGVLKKEFLYRDHLASVRAVTDSNGALKEKTLYAAYGEPTNKVMTASKGYIGERYDQESGLSYLNFRYMNGGGGFFISPDDWDPTQEGVGTNRYAYAGGDLPLIISSRMD